MAKAIYSYKVCYKLKGKKRLKVYLITNTYDLAEWQVRWYENNPPLDRKTGKIIQNAEWLIIPIKSLIEHKWRWRGCPF